MSGIVGLFLVPSLGPFSIFWFVFQISNVLVLFYLVTCYYLLEVCLFLVRDKNRGGSRWEEMWCGEELDRVEGGETIIPIYHVEEKNLFSRKGNHQGKEYSKGQNDKP